MVLEYTGYVRSENFVFLKTGCWIISQYQHNVRTGNVVPDFQGIIIHMLQNIKL